MISRIDRVDPDGVRRSASMNRGQRTKLTAESLRPLVLALLAHAEEELATRRALRGGKSPRPKRERRARASEDSR